jgi:lipopolysaccharide heptosyltransferase II
LLFLRPSVIFFEHEIISEHWLTDTSSVPKRILVVRTDRLGDVILTLPMFALLRKCFPDAYVAVLLRRYAGEILDGNPYVDEILWYDRDGALVPFREMCATLRERKFDTAVVVYPRLRLAWLMFRSGIPLRVGTGYRYYSFLFNRKVYEHRKDARRHELEYNLRLLRTIGCNVPEDFVPEFFINVPPAVDAAVDELLLELRVAARELAIVHPGSGGSAREWPPRHFGMLAARLADEGFAVLVTGTKEEEEKINAVVDASGGVAIALAGRLSIKQLAALLRRAKVFVANSTGPLHLAVAMGVPVVGLYPQHTAMSATRWGPYTDRKAVLIPDRPKDCTACVENKTECACMASIEVERVLHESLRLIRQNDPRGANVHAD